MKLYYTKGACSLTVRIILHEIGVKAEFESVDLKTKKTESGADFFTINPKGSVPVLEIKEKEILTENAIILQYLADTNKATNLLPDIGDLNRYRILEWVNYITTELHKGFSPLFNPKISNETKEEVFIPAIKTKFDFINQTFKGPYLTGNEFTLPDAYLFVILRWAKAFNIDIASYNNLTRFFNKMKERPAVHKALSEEGLT